MTGRHIPAFPSARTSDLEVTHADGEVLVFDSTSLEAHCLNGPAALVWGYCDGETSVEAMVERLAADSGAPVDDAVVQYALRQLADRNLLDGPAMKFDPVTTGRRQMLIRLAGAAVALPVITSIVAPTAAAAASAPGSGSGTTGGSGSGSSGGGVS